MIDFLHAMIICGATQLERVAILSKKLSEWKIAPIDQIFLVAQNLSLGIFDIALFKQRLILAPYRSQFTVGVIRSSDALTIEAQHALLKTLEEPPPHAKIILELENIETLLPTIRSRCQVIRLGFADAVSEQERSEWLGFWKTMVEKGAGERLTLVSELITNREDALSWVTCGIYALQKNLSSDIQSSCDASRYLRRLLKAQEMLSANVTPKLVIDSILLALPRP